MNQLHAVIRIYRSLLVTKEEKETFEQELAACFESDLETYRIHVGVLKP
ncbi:hypothetical protein [uncultured Bacteroides sp.]|nr:hypothetical protein [uncultured Bacteroides sp.]